MSRVQAVVDSVREFYLLREAETRARSLPEDRLAKLRTEVTLSRQKREAAQTLWLYGSRAEAMRLAAEALEILSTTARDLAKREEPAPAAVTADGTPGEAPKPPTPAPLESFLLRSDPKLLTEIDSVLQKNRKPALDADVKSEDAEAFDSSVSWQHALDAAIAPLTQSKTERLQSRILRIAVTACAFVVLVLIGIDFARTPHALKAEASARFNYNYPPEQVVDGKKETEWVLPDRMPGWVDVQVIPARKISRVRVLNMHNAPYNDRATKDYQIQALYKGQVVKAQDGTWPEFSENPEWTTMELGMTVDHVRVEVKSWHRMGGGIAEIAVE